MTKASVARSAPSRLCSHCGSQFRPQRSTARFCSPRCRVAAQRARNRIGMSGGQKPQSVTLRRKPPKLDPRIVPDPKWPGMYRVRRPDGSLTDMVNLTRAKDALAEMRGAS